MHIIFKILFRFFPLLSLSDLHLSYYPTVVSFYHAMVNRKAQKMTSRNVFFAYNDGDLLRSFEIGDIVGAIIMTLRELILQGLHAFLKTLF